MQIKEFNRANLAHLRDAIDEALTKVAQDFDLESIKLGRMRFSGTEFSSSIEAQVKADNNEAVIRKQTEESAMCGYDGNIVGRVIEQSGKTFKITGFNLRKSKFPICTIEVVSQKAYGFAAGSKVVGVAYDRKKNIFTIS